MARLIGESKAPAAKAIAATALYETNGLVPSILLTKSFGHLDQQLQTKDEQTPTHNGEKKEKEKRTTTTGE